MSSRRAIILRPVHRFAQSMLLLSVVTACGGADAPTSTTPPAIGPAAGRIVITAPASSVGLGDPLQLSSAVYGPGNQLFSNVTPSYTISDSSKASVDVNGRVVGFATGVVNVVATYQIIPAATFGITLTAGTGAWGEGFLYGGTNNEGGDNIVTDAGGNVYVAGATAVGQGGSDAFVTRFLPNGKIAWTRLIATPGLDGANGIALHRSGGVVVNSSNVFGSQVQYLDASGRTVWTRALVSAGFNDVATDGAGNVYVAGNAIRPNAGGSICPGVPLPAPNSVTTGGAGDGLLLKFSADGTQLWCRLWTYVSADQTASSIPSFDTQGVSIAIDEMRGAVYVGGVVQLNAFFGLAPYVRRMTLSDGTSSWMKFINHAGTADAPTGRLYTFAQSDVALLHGITVDGAGDVWTAMSEDNASGYEAYVAKLSPDGALRLRRTIAMPGTTGNRAVTAITYRKPQNDVVLIASWGDLFILRGNYRNGTIVGLDMNATEKWRTVINGTPIGAVQPTASVRGITSTATGDVYLSGETTGNFAGFENSSVVANRTGLDILVARITGRP